MQRNGQNPIRAEKTFKQGRGRFNPGEFSQNHTPGSMTCPACKAEVPPKPGFRMSSLKCPACGTAMRK